MAKITLPNGAVVEGTEDFIKSFLSSVSAEDGIHYNSSTKGSIKIKEMDTRHLRNSILKAMRESLEKVKTYDTKQLLNYFRNGVGSDSITVIAMVKELNNRRD